MLVSGRIFAGPVIGGVVELSVTDSVFGAPPQGLPAGPHPVCGVAAALAAGVTGLGAPVAGGVALASAAGWAGWALVYGRHMSDRAIHRAKLLTDADGHHDDESLSETRQRHGCPVRLAGHRQGVLLTSVGQLGGGDPVQRLGHPGTSPACSRAEERRLHPAGASRVADQ